MFSIQGPTLLLSVCTALGKGRIRAKLSNSLDLASFTLKVCRQPPDVEFSEQPRPPSCHRCARVLFKSILDICLLHDPLVMQIGTWTEAVDFRRMV